MNKIYQLVLNYRWQGLEKYRFVQQFCNIS